MASKDLIRQNIEHFIKKAVILIITRDLMDFFFHMCYVTCTFTADIEIRLYVQRVTCKLNKINTA